MNIQLKYKPEMAMLFFNLFMVDRALVSLFDHIYSKYELTTKQWLVLAVATNIERPTINNVALQLKTSHQNVKAIVLNLKKVGLANLVQDPTDKRTTLIVGSPKLEQLNKTRGTKDQDSMALLFGAYSAQELTEFSDYIDRLLEQVEQIKGKIR